MCQVLRVSRSGYYAWRRRPASDREMEDGALAPRIHAIHRESRGVYGSPRIYRTLRDQGQRCGKHRVARIMRLEGLRGRAKQRFRFTATKRSEMPAAPNLLERRFHVETPNRVWAGDITQLRTREGWLFLAVLLDLFSRRVVGFATGARPEQELVKEALEMALETRKPEPGLLHHSDRGGQYASADYQDLLDRHGAVCSMSRPGNCLDNAVVESFFHTLKTEWLYHYRFRTRQEARLAIFDYIESFYNRTRMHSTLDYCSPDEYERLNVAA